MSAIRTTDFDAIAASAPLDATAATVRDGGGDHWSAKLPDHVLHWSAPPIPIGQRSPTNLDLTGLRVGRLVVTGYYGASAGKWAPPLWIVRCVCGDYETRRQEKLLKARDSGRDACCHACETVEQIRARGSRPSTRTSRRKAAAMLDKIAGRS